MVPQKALTTPVTEIFLGRVAGLKGLHRWSFFVDILGSLETFSQNTIGQYLIASNLPPPSLSPHFLCWGKTDFCKNATWRDGMDNFPLAKGEGGDSCLRGMN